MLSSSLVGIFEATKNINTALDECLLDAEENVTGDFPAIVSELQDVIADQKRPREAPAELIASSLELLKRYRSLGDAAQALETSTAGRLEVFGNRGIRNKEAELLELETLARAIGALGQARQAVEALANVALPVEVRAESFLALNAIGARPKTDLARWLAHQVDFFQMKVRLQLQDEVALVMKQTSASLFQQQHGTRLPESLSRAALLIPLCVRVQCAQLGTPKKEMDQPCWGIELFAKPALIRFRYHFFSEKSTTNRVDRPEWFVGFVLESVRDRLGFMREHLQPSCAGCLVDVVSQFARYFVLAVHQRLEASWGVLRADNEVLLGHTIDELLVGDRVLMAEFGYAPHWPKMCSFFSTNPTRMGAWIKVCHISF
jgi:hypothetical protein